MRSAARLAKARVSQHEREASLTRTSLAYALEQVRLWQLAQDEVVQVELALSRAMAQYAVDLTEPPRALIIDAQRRRVQAERLFEAALQALDAHSVSVTGHTDFGTLR
jgi:hypothetical protein